MSSESYPLTDLLLHADDNNSVFNLRASLLITFLIAFGGTVSAKPNIIIFVADDLGWNDLSFHGSPQIPTPNIDSLARRGIMLNNYYVCPLCSPSRGALMTGLYPIHTGLQHGVINSSHKWGLSLKSILLPEWFKSLGYTTHAIGKHDVIYVNEPWGLPLSHTILPQHLRKLGYATHAIGKWHLGFFHKEYTPTYRGFDSHYGYWGGKEDYFDHTQEEGAMWGLDFHHNLKPVTDTLGNYSTQLYTNHALNIIEDHNSSNPLLLYVAYQAVHSANLYAPLQAPPEYVKRFPNITDKNRRIFAGMVSAMDDSVGSIVKSLNRKNMLKNSIVMFTTDNGGPAAGFNDNAASNWPLRGVKATLWEGGVRGISFIWSPLLNNQERVSMDLMHVTDWLPTLYHAAGGNVSALGTLDGQDMWDTLSSHKPSPRTEVLLNIDPITRTSALRVQNYKVIQGTMYDGQWDGWYGPSGRENNTELHGQYDVTNAILPGELNCGAKPKNASTDCLPALHPCLFDVVKDPCEYHNLASEKPEILSSLLKRLSAYNETAIKPGNQPSDPKSAPKYHNYQWVNWMDYV